MIHPTQHPDGHTPAVERLLAEFEKLLYEFADSATDKDGNIDAVGSSGFNIASKSVKDFLLHAYVEGIRTSMEMVGEKKIKGASILRQEGSDFTTPRMSRAIGYQDAIDDLTSTLHDVLERVEPEIISNEK